MMSSHAQNLLTKAATRADLANFKADLCRQLWFVGAVIVTLNAVLMTAALTLTRFLSQ